MPTNLIEVFLPIIIFIVLLSFSFFLNYVSSLYSEVDLFKLDLNKEKKKKKFKRLIFILKNNQLLFALISFLQVILNMIITVIFIEKIDEKLFLRINKFIFFLGIGLFTALFTEIYSRYLANKAFSKQLSKNKFFINFTYSLIRIPFWMFGKIVKPKKKLFINSEIDVIRFINNLESEKLLEKKEASLVKSAFKFDELQVRSIFIPWKKVVTINENMNYEEIQKIYSQNLFNQYPVFNKKNKLIGIFNWEIFNWNLINKKNSDWKNQIEKDIIFVYPNEKLDRLFEKLQAKYCKLAIVKKSKNNESFLGLITLQDIIESLVGKMKDEKDKLVPARIN